MLGHRKERRVREQECGIYFVSSVKLEHLTDYAGCAAPL